MSDACVLDTYPWLHTIEQTGKIPRRAQRLIDHGVTLHVPTMCMWEVSMLLARGRIAFRDDRITCERWLAAAGAAPCEITPITPRIAACCAELDAEGFHGDPADRVVYATARTLDVPLITGDQRIHAFEKSLPRKARRLAVWD